MCPKLKHASHNESLCDKLIELKHYPDWVITTAFYSSIHFIDHKIFPVKIGDKTYNTIDQYRIFINSSRPKSISRHSARKNIVSEQLPYLKGEFNYLMKQSEAARYVNYDVLPASSTIAVKNLKTIKKFCCK
jgi:hypothetical protein